MKTMNDGGIKIGHKKIESFDDDRLLELHKIKMNNNCLKGLSYTKVQITL